MWIRCLTGLEREGSRGQRYGVKRWLVGNGIRCSTFHDTQRQTPDTWPGTEMEEVGDRRINSAPYWRCHSRGNRGFWDRARFRSVSAWLGRLNTFGLFQEKRLRFILHWTSSEVVPLMICFLIVEELDFSEFLIGKQLENWQTSRRWSVGLCFEQFLCQVRFCGCVHS